MSMSEKLRDGAPRWWRRIAAVVGASLALVAATGVPAHALESATLIDDFESPDSGNTWRTESGAQANFRIVASSEAHSPSHVGALDVGSTALGRYVTLPGVMNSSTACRAMIWLNPAMWPTVNIEVIDPRDGSDISARTVTPVPGSGWKGYPVRPWTPQTSRVYFRVSNVSEVIGEAELDDLTVLCWWL